MKLPVKLDRTYTGFTWHQPVLGVRGVEAPQATGSAKELTFIALDTEEARVSLTA